MFAALWMFLLAVLAAVYDRTLVRLVLVLGRGRARGRPVDVDRSLLCCCPGRGRRPELIGVAIWISICVP